MLIDPEPLQRADLLDLVLGDVRRSLAAWLTAMINESHAPSWPGAWPTHSAVTVASGGYGAGTATEAIQPR